MAKQTIPTDEPVNPLNADEIRQWGRDLLQNIPALRETENYNRFSSALENLVARTS